MKRNFIINTHKYFNWFIKDGVDIPNKLFQAIDEAEYRIRTAYDTDIEEYTIVSHTQYGDDWHHVVIAFKNIEDDGDVSYVKHTFRIRFRKYSKVPQIDALSFTWGDYAWGDTLPETSFSSSDDKQTAWDMLNAINKYFNHSMW